MEDLSGVTRSILNAVQDEFRMSGLSNGLYGEYASTVAARIVFHVLCEVDSAHLSDEERYKITNSIETALDDG